MTLLGRKVGRRSIALITCGIIAAVCGTLIAFEQIPILYLLATVSLVVLLLIVAFSDLENVGRGMIDES